MSRLRKWFSRSDSSRPRSLPWLARSFNCRRALLDFARQHRARKVQQLALRREAEHRKHVRLLDLVTAKADELVQRGLGVAHGTLGSRAQWHRARRGRS